jgi:hypothetical protein
MTDLDELRAEVAAAYGLPREAITFLAGTTVHEIEANAVKLAELVGSRREQEQAPVDPLAAVLRDGPALKAERARALVRALHGPRQPQRDASGRFSSSGGFDGGARQPAPTRQSPEREHDEIVVQMARLSRTFGARGF